MSEFGYASFMVRLWREPEAASGNATAWQGELESVQTGQTWRFQDLDALQGLMAEKLAGDPSTVQADQDSPGDRLHDPEGQAGADRWNMQ